MSRLRGSCGFYGSSEDGGRLPLLLVDEAVLYPTKGSGKGKTTRRKTVQEMFKVVGDVFWCSIEDTEEVMMKIAGQGGISTFLVVKLC